MVSKIAPVTMYDSATPAKIPASAQVVGGYIDGDYAWSESDWDRFPDADKVLITVTGAVRANVADVENSDMTPAQAKEWIETKQSRGLRGCTIYCARANLDKIWAACRGLAYYVWVADWTDNAHRVEHTVATQYKNVGEDYDVSEVYSQEWLNVLHRANQPWPFATGSIDVS